MPHALVDPGSKRVLGAPDAQGLGERTRGKKEPMVTLILLGMLAVGGLIVLAAVLALLKLVLVLVLLPLRLAFRLVLLPIRLVFGLLLLPLVLLVCAVCGIGVAAGLFALAVPLLPLALVAWLVWLLMKRAPAARPVA